MVIIMIKITNVSKSFSTNNVLSNINLEINKGSIFGLVGINGAGKSTLLRLLSGVYTADKGEITIGGNNIVNNQKVKEKLFFLPDEPYYTYRISGEDLKDLYSSYYNFDSDLFYKHLDAFKIDSKKSIHNFSKGMKRQLFISLALSCQPDYILLDEAFDGLDPLARLYFKRELIRLSEENQMTVIISSHALRELEDICDSYGLIDHNKITSQGSLDNALSQLFKYQLAFNTNVTKDMISSVEIKTFSQEGKIIKLTFKGEQEKFLEEIKKYDPILIDQISVSFEDLFIEEVESRGYLK